MRYFIVLDMPETTYPVSDDFYALDGPDPYGRGSLADWMLSALDESTGSGTFGPPDDITVYTELDDLLHDKAEGLDMFKAKEV